MCHPEPRRGPYWHGGGRRPGSGRESRTPHGAPWAKLCSLPVLGPAGALSFCPRLGPGCHTPGRLRRRRRAPPGNTRRPRAVIPDLQKQSPHVASQPFDLPHVQKGVGSRAEILQDCSGGRVPGEEQGSMNTAPGPPWVAQWQVPAGAQAPAGVRPTGPRANPLAYSLG